MTHQWDDANGCKWFVLLNSSVSDTAFAAFKWSVHLQLRQVNNTSAPSAKAAATAYVLLGLVVPKLVGGERNNMPAVLQKAGCWKLPAGVGCLRDGTCYSFKSMTRFFTSSFFTVSGVSNQNHNAFIICKTIVAGPLRARNSGLCVGHLQRWVL